jgi:hypothetical protein
VISGFIEFSLLSDNQELRQFTFSGNTWLSTFEAYLDRFEDGKPKPMRQILASLTKILVKHLDTKDTGLVRSNTANLVISNIILSEPRAKLRACICALEFLLRKDAFSAMELITFVEKWLLRNHNRWVPLMEEHCYNLDIPLKVLLDAAPRSSSPNEDKLTFSAKVFTLALLLAAQNRDIASPAGLLFSTLCRKLKIGTVVNRFPYVDPVTLNPFWTLSLKYVMLRNVTALETISNQILYPLFKADPSSFRHFVDDLPVETLRSGLVPAVPSAEFVLLFSTLQVAKELGIVHEDREWLPTPCDSDRS